MWPIQTLTLLLCLTDEEQLFAQSIPMIQEPVRIEHVATPPASTSEESSIAFPEA